MSVHHGMVKTSARGEKQQTKSYGSTWFYLGLVGQIGYTIAIPIAGGAIIGSYIDREFSMYPKGTLTGLVLGSLLSVIGFVHVIIDALKVKK